MPKRKRNVIGEDTSNNIASRGDLRAENMPHGEVFRGPLADRALSAVGARAMTVDDEIIVNHSFDRQSPEDQALYAHEMYHQEHSGGEAGASIRDAEEIGARAVEAMVFHRAKNGHADPIPQSPTELLRDAKSNDSSASAQSESEDNSPNIDRASPQGGYHVLASKGMNHEEIVQFLARKLITEMERKEGEKFDINAAFRSFI